MNEYDVPGDVIRVGSSLTDEGVEKQLEALHAEYIRNTNADKAWQALTQNPPDVAEFSRYTVTLRMDSEYTTFTELINGKSPDITPPAPDTLTAIWNEKSVDIPVTFCSLHDYSGLGFWLEINGTRSWRVLRSKSWQSNVIDKTQLTLPWLLDGEGEQDDKGRITKADLRAKVTDPATVPVDIHLSGNHESGITLFSTDTLHRISKRNRLLRFTPAPPVDIDYTDPGEDISAHLSIEAAGKFIATPADERGAYVDLADRRLAVSIHKVDYPNQSSLPLDEIGLHSDSKARRIYDATVLELINSDKVMGRFRLDDLCKSLSQSEWRDADHTQRQKIRTNTLRTLLLGSWTSVGNSNDLASVLNIQFIHRNDEGEVEALTIAVPPWMQQSTIKRRGQAPQLESEYSRTHRSEGTLRAIGYLPGGSVGFKSYAIGIAEWMSLHEAVSRGSERSFIRQQMLNEIIAIPTLKKLLSDKTHKTRIVEYYCKALHSLLAVPKGAELVQILDYGDAEIIREHREPHKRLKAWMDYESIGNVDRWLKQRVTLCPASYERSIIADELKDRQIKRASRVKYYRPRKR